MSISDHDIIEMFRQRVDRTIHEIYYSFQISRQVFRGLSASTIPAERKWCFKLFKLYIDCFSSMCELITMAASNFLDECKKQCGIGK